jgi:hypothetical protein
MIEPSANPEIYAEAQWMEIAYLTDGMGLHGAWFYITRDLPSLPEAKLAFFCILKKLLDTGQIKLAKRGVYLEGTSEDLVQMFRDSFPLTEESVAHIGGIENWFFADDCPGGAVWIRDDGTEEWT